MTPTLTLRFSTESNYDQSLIILNNTTYDFEIKTFEKIKFNFKNSLSIRNLGILV